MVPFVNAILPVVVDLEPVAALCEIIIDTRTTAATDRVVVASPFADTVTSVAIDTSTCVPLERPLWTLNI